MSTTQRAAFALMVGLLGSCLSLPAQETQGGIQGTVKDSSGGAVPNATIEISGPALVGTRKIQTDSAGAYRFSQLPPGDYTITVSASGFTTVKQPGIHVDAGRLPSIDVTLEVGAVTQTVEVSETAQIVDVTQSKVAVDVQKDVIANVPKSRSFQSLITFAPGARMEPLQGGRNDRGDSFQVDGASDAENVYMVDGVNMTDAQNGGVGKNFQTDWLQTPEPERSLGAAERRRRRRCRWVRPPLVFWTAGPTTAHRKDLIAGPYQILSCNTSAQTDLPVDPQSRPV